MQPGIDAGWHGHTSVTKIKRLRHEQLSKKPMAGEVVSQKLEVRLIVDVATRFPDRQIVNRGIGAKALVVDIEIAGRGRDNYDAHSRNIAQRPNQFSRGISSTTTKRRKFIRKDQQSQNLSSIR